MYTIGCDHHKHYCIMNTFNGQGEDLGSQKFLYNNLQALQNYLKDLPEGSRVAVEACGYESWLCDLMESAGLEVHLAHPLKTKAIAEAKIKTDQLDAKALGQLLKADLLPEAYYAPVELRAQRSLLRYRQGLVRFSTTIKNKIHFMLDRQGIRPPALTDLFGQRGRQWLAELKLAEPYGQFLQGYLSILDYLADSIKQAEAMIRRQIKESPQAKLLQTIPGIGILSAFALLSEIGPIDRFADAGKLCSYAGLVPSLHQSGQKYYHGQITKQGNKYIRWIVTEAAQRAVRYDPRLNTFYLKIRRKKGSSKAIVATARKLLCYVFYVLKRNEPYRFQPILSNEPGQHPAALTA